MAKLSVGWNAAAFMRTVAVELREIAETVSEEDLARALRHIAQQCEGQAAELDEQRLE